MKRIDLGEVDAIEDAAAEFVEALAYKDEDDWRAAGAEIQRLVLAPLAEHFGDDARRLLICPDAALAAVPFAALPTIAGGPLSDRLTISCVSQAQDLVPRTSNPAPGTGAFLLGGVDYDGATSSGAGASESSGSARAPRGGRYDYLKGTKAEVETLQSALPMKTQAVLGNMATEQSVRAAAKGKRLLHFATHGFVRTNLMRGLKRRGDDKTWIGADAERQLVRGHDPLLLAGLALAGANPRKGGGGDDGILTALEASHLDLDGAELVVLSACQTALGTAESGEGVIGLVRGFQMAGAKQVIGSLWKVDDDATKALMVKFYELWSPKDGKGLAAADALRGAQAFVRQNEKWKHPYYWAAWVLWGTSD